MNLGFVLGGVVVEAEIPLHENSDKKLLFNVYIIMTLVLRKCRNSRWLVKREIGPVFGLWKKTEI